MNKRRTSSVARLSVCLFLAMLVCSFAFAGVVSAGTLPPGVTATVMGPNPTSSDFPATENYTISNFKNVVSAQYGAVYTGTIDAYGYDESNPAGGYTVGTLYSDNVASNITSDLASGDTYIYVLPTGYSTPNLGVPDPVINTYKTLMLVYDDSNGNQQTLYAHDYDEITFGIPKPPNPGTESFPISNATPSYFEQF